MALKIRLRQQGRNNRQTFRLVVMDIRSKRDGKYIEKLGWYDPLLIENNIYVDADRTQYWLNQGAEMTHDAERLVAKQAPTVFKAWNEKREAKRVKLTAKRRELRRRKAKAVASK